MKVHNRIAGVFLPRPAQHHATEGTATARHEPAAQPPPCHHCGFGARAASDMAASSDPPPVAAARTPRTLDTFPIRARNRLPGKPCSITRRGDRMARSDRT